jgi:hypothetical protein
LTSCDWEALDGAAFEVLRFRLDNYIRADPPACEWQNPCGGTKKPADYFGVTVFASATSDKLADYNNGFAIGRYLRNFKKGAALCTGGGDQHAMGAILVGYERDKNDKESRHHLTCASTPDIVKVETIYGRLPPECDRWELHEKIGTRIETLYDNDLFISIPGGDGTGQEVNGILLKKLNNDPEMLGKPMIFVGNTASMHAEIASIIGKDSLDKLRENPYALDHLEIYLVPTAQAAQPIIRSYYEAFHAKRQTALDLVHKHDVPVAAL